ncbi:MAG: signal peptidase I [Planctomycetota bacterium]|nr:MAG: signal peptidase I [Planctomycetota bacterium]
MAQNLFSIQKNKEEWKDILAQLDEKKIPKAIKTAFQEEGYSLAGNTKIEVKHKGQSWLFVEEDRHYLLDYYPRKEKAWVYGIAGKPAVGAILENVEALLVALIFALLIRHFTLEAFVIPTGSMAPTLLGIHAQVTCPNCHYSFSVGNPSFEPGQSSRTLDLVCPNCLLGSQKSLFQKQIRRKDLRGGDKILVNKFYYLWKKPKRWDVIVFLSPQKHHKNFIKRLVGLPGETLQIFHGDLFRKNPKTGKMEILRKPDSVQKHLWMNVYNSAYLEEKKNRIIWETPKEEVEEKLLKETACTECDQVVYQDVRFQWQGNQLNADCTKKKGVLKFHRPIYNIYGYNRALRGGNLVGDIRCTFEGKFSSQGRIVVDLSRPLKRFQVKMDFKAKKIILYEGAWKEEKILEKPFPVSAEKWHHYDIAHVDGQIWLKVDGIEKIRYLYPSPLTVEDEDQQRFWLKFRFFQSQVNLRKLHIYRDIHYTDSLSNFGVNEPVTLKQDEYFALGDNSPNSQDSRDWGPVPAKNLLGRAFIVFWPAIPYFDWKVRWIR